MKRDLDLARQLLFDIEARGADCSVSALRTDRSALNGTHPASFETSSSEIDERVRYHLRLLIDGGFLKEVDRTTAGVPCVRLTHEGCELIELSRSESLWQEAKWLCQERSGGESLTVIRTFLIRLATGPRDYLPDVRRRRTVLSRPGYLATTDDRPVGNRVRYVRVRPTAENIVERPLEYVTDLEARQEYETQCRYDLDYETAFPTHLI